MKDMRCISVNDFQHPAGWAHTPNSEARMRWYCEQLEDGQILMFESVPFDLGEEDLQFLLSRQHTDSRHHKNISYRQEQDELRGFSSDRRDDVRRLHGIMRDHSALVARFLSEFLVPYASHWSLDLASFRPLEESVRTLPLHKRNDLIHVDAFPSRPTRGGRILRVFTNIHPTLPRVWVTTDRFGILVQRFAKEAGLSQIAARVSSRLRAFLRRMASLGRAARLSALDRSPYDQFMLRFHDYLKENHDFQQECAKTRLEFPPRSTWIAFTDAFPHAVLSGQFALEQTFIIPYRALVAPHQSPLYVLESLCGKPLSA